MNTLLAFLFVLGVLVFVHELGHFLAARRLGVRVLTFSLGFGPKLLKIRRGDTEYCVSAIPLGGYVKMAGENPDDPRTGRPDEFLSRTKWERFQILIMGPVMNVVLAVVVMAVVLAQGAEVPVYQDQPPVIGAVAAGSPAERAGIQRGDRIVSVAGDQVETWDDLFIAIGTRADRDVAVGLVRNGQMQTVSVRPQPETRYEIGNIGVLPDINPIVASVIAGEPAERAGLKAGDVVLAVNGERMVTRTQLIEAISRNGGQEIELTVRREGQDVRIGATPEQRGDRGMLGLYVTEPTRRFDPNAFEAIQLSIERNIEFSGLIFKTLGGLFVGDTSPRQLMGPVAIAQLSGESAQAGWIALFTLMASISLNLGLLNLLPIPVLDGGHILIMAVEGIARRDFSMAVKEKMLLAGFVLLMMLMVTVIYNDLTRISWIERLMPWRN
ncbi:MAG: RIP metalloprotease RseP [Acidobacteria bacterium RIFCSPLOWO2_12_FULL_67_14]|nr:MAG: RIP metalloprotease RseP [Acidobacteria bacterium RIFCSPLOWO2_02_FULL_67_21]OFW36836.1 MAG: RIP metalloprotease RseP [Acidobacteria bacterium RIFCSPLOWO2_12_FULL_67_14]